jgi:hypothetical protein
MAPVMRLGLLIALLASLAGAARWSAGVEEADLMHHHRDEKAPSTWQLPKDATYKNQKPLIGILTQPCHDCPGEDRQMHAAGIDRR